jgi:hypothetical protein
MAAMNFIISSDINCRHMFITSMDFDGIGDRNIRDVGSYPQ